MGNSGGSEETSGLKESELFVLEEYVRPGLTLEDVVMIKKVFDSLDTNGDEEVTLLQVMEKYAPEALEEDIQLESPKLDLYLSKSSGLMMPNRERLHKEDPLENLISQKLRESKGYSQRRRRTDSREGDGGVDLFMCWRDGDHASRA